MLLLVPAGPLSAQAAQATPAARPSLLFVSLVSGTYGGDQSVQAEALVPGLSIRYSIRDPDGTAGPWIAWREPLALGAAPGEERDYRVIVRADADGKEQERRELWVRIDKRPPAPPLVLPAQRTTWGPVALSFQPRAADDKVFYVLQGDLTKTPIPWDGKEITLGTPGQKEDDVVQAYAVDPAGNRSALVTARYTIDARPAVLDVQSPVPGTFANPQPLALTFRNVEWIRYTLDGTDPATGGIPYTGITTLRKQGTSTLRIAAQPRSASSPILRRDVTWTYAPDGSLQLDVESGLYPKGVSATVLSRPGGTLYYALWEKSPTDSDYMAGARITIPPPAAAPSLVTMRLRALSDSGAWGSEYRCVFVVGSGAPALPRFSLSDPEPLRVTGHVQVLSDEDTLLFVTTDRSAPSVLGAPSRGLVDVTPLPGVTSALIRAVAVDGTGAASPVAERKLVLDSDPGAAPSLVQISGGSVAPVIGAAGNETRQLVFEVSSDGSDPPAPTAGSPRLSLPLALSLPFGARRTFKLRAAALDSSGRVLAASTVAVFAVNRRPPGPPTLSPGPGVAVLDESATLSVTSPAAVAFSITSDGSTPADPSPSAAKPAAPIPLPGKDGAAVTYRLKLVAVDDAGNTSETYGPYSYAVDLRAPQIPALQGIRDGARYSTRTVSPSPAESAWKTYYTYTTDGSVPPDPGAGSAELTSGTVFAGEDGAVTTFHVKLVATSRSGKRTGERRAIAFTIDLKPPDVPAVSGATEGTRYARPVTVKVDAAPPDTTLFYSVSTSDDDPPDPVSAGQPVPGPLAFDVPEDVRRAFTLRFAAQDDAGNRSLYDRRVRFTIDREVPDDPKVGGAPQAGISGRPVTLTLTAGAPTVVYEMTEDGSMPRVPTAASQAYAGPLLLSGRAGASVTYRLLPRAIDDLGNASRAATITTVVVDRTIPGLPAAPHVTWSAENPGVAYFSWEAPAQGRLLYRIRSGSAAAGDFVPFEAPVAVEVSPDGSTITADAVVANSAGTVGAISTFTRTFGRQLAPPSIRGARDGGVSSQRIELTAAPSGATVRYTVATDGSYPPEVTAASPVFPASLVLDAADGQTVEVRLAARAFDAAGAAQPSDAAVLAVTIDRTPPDPPSIDGIEDGGYYQDTRRVSLLAPEGVIYEGVTTDGQSFVPAQIDANRYAGELSLGAGPGQTTHYRVVAYTVDAAGNRSRETRTWSFTVDRATVYAGPAGNDYADGSRTSPVRSLSRALALAAASSRKTVLLAAGEYQESGEVTLSPGVSVVGGLDPDAWTPLGLDRVSVVVAASPWKSGAALLRLDAGSVALSGMEVRGGGASGSPAGALPLSLISVSGGDLKLDRVTVTLQNAPRAQGILATGGTLLVTNSHLRADKVRQGTLLAATGGTVNVGGSTFDGPAEADDFAAMDFTDAGSVVLSALKVSPGAGQKTRGIRALRSTLSVKQATIDSGSGSLEAFAIDASQSRITLHNVGVATLASARTPTGILASQTTVVFDNGTIDVAGASSASGISVRGGELSFSRSTINGSGLREYASLLRVEDARALVANNVLRGADAGQTIGASLKGGVVDLVNNTVVAGTGSTTTIGVLIQGDAMPRIVNNIFARSGATRGTAVEVMGARSDPFAQGPGARPLILLTNAFTGWQQVLRVDFAPELGREAQVVPGAAEVNDADADHFAGPSSGNIATDFGSIFRAPGSYRVARDWQGLDAGTDILDPQGIESTGPVMDVAGTEVRADHDGKPRPAAQALRSPGPPRGWDIGADEYSE